MSRLVGKYLFTLLLCGINPLWAAPDFDVLGRSIVRVVSETEEGFGTGTGFVVNKDGYVVTNHHVIDGAMAIGVVPTGTDDVMKARDLIAWEELDLAVFRVPGLEVPPVTLSLAEPEKGQKVWAIGYPSDADREMLAHDPTVQDGVIGRIFRGRWLTQDLRIIQHNAPTNPGNSGGPLLDDCGNAIGVNTQGSLVLIERASGDYTRVPHATGIYWSSHIRETVRFLRNNGIAFQDGDSVCPGAAVLAIAPEQLREAMEASNRQVIIMGLLLAGVALVTLALALKKPRQQLLQAAQRISRHSGKSANTGAGKKPAPLRQNPRGQGLALSGVDGRGRPVYIALPSSRFNGQRLGVSLGRHPDLVDEVVNDNSISRRHLRVRQDGGALSVEDLNSTNGTSVNQRRLASFKPEPLDYGSTLTMGSLDLNVSRL